MKYVIVGPSDPTTDDNLYWSLEWEWVNFTKCTHFPKMVFSIPLPLYTTGIQEINELGERGKFYRTTLDYPRGSMELFHA